LAEDFISNKDINSSTVDNRLSSPPLPSSFCQTDSATTNITTHSNNNNFDSIGRRNQIEYITDPQTRERRVKTYLEQTGRRKAYKHGSKVQQRIDWRRNKLSEYLIRGMSLPEVSRVMNIPYKTLYEDQCFLTKQARENMKNHIADLPFNIKQATDGLNKLISMLYDIQDLDVINAQGRKGSDHVRVMAIGLIKDCIKEKIEILTSQGAINHALDFIDKTKQLIKDDFNEDMQQVIEQDKVESLAINDAIEKNPEIRSFNDDDANNESQSTTVVADPEKSEEDTLEGADTEQEEEEEQQIL
jgi:hypothetical protein